MARDALYGERLQPLGARQSGRFAVRLFQWHRLRKLGKYLGIWNPIDDRDAEALRRIATIERAFWQLLESPHWEPFVPVLRYGVFASKWPGHNQTLWTIVN